MAITDSGTQTPQEFLRELFEFEYCHECMGDEQDHEVVIAPVGNYFAMCKGERP